MSIGRNSTLARAKAAVDEFRSMGFDVVGVEFGEGRSFKILFDGNSKDTKGLPNVASLQDHSRITKAAF